MGKRHTSLVIKKEEWLNKMSRAYDAVNMENKERWLDTLPKELREIKLTRL